MKIKRILLAIPVCALLMAAPFAGLKTQAVTVDIKDYYDAGLLSEDKDTKAEAKRQAEEDAEGTAASSASSTASTAASTAASTTQTAATTAASTTPTAASSTASTVVPTSTAASTTASTAASTDLPKTGDDDRIMITMTVMLASLAVFLTTLMAGRIGKNA